MDMARVEEPRNQLDKPLSFHCEFIKRALANCFQFIWKVLPGQKVAFRNSSIPGDEFAPGAHVRESDGHPRIGREDTGIKSVDKLE